MYFPEEGAKNTAKTIELAVQAAAQRGIGYIVVASNTGETAELLAGTGAQVVCVTHVNGFAEKGKNEMPEDTRARLHEKGVKTLTTTHVLSGAERGISRRSGGAYPVELVAQTLRMLGHGMKVCVECSIMALDAGLIPYGEKVMAVGGTLRGADTAVVLTPGHADSLFDTRVHEVICKPML
jgi:hypothetical protein